MSKKRPVSFVDFYTTRRAAGDKPLIIARKGSYIKLYKPTPSQAVKVARLIRSSNRGRVYPFVDGWLWEADEE